MMMAGSKELKCASEAMEQKKGASSSLPRSFDVVSSTKAPKNRTRGSTYQGKLSRPHWPQCCLLVQLHWSIEQRELPAKIAKQIAQQFVTYGPQNVSKIGPSKWLPCNQLIFLSCIWKLGMVPKAGSEKKTPKWGPDRTKTEEKHLTPGPDPAPGERAGGSAATNLPRCAPHSCRNLRRNVC